MKANGAQASPDFRDEFERRVMASALARVLHWPVADLVELLASESPQAKRLRPLTLGELQVRAVDAELKLDDQQVRAADAERRAHAERLSGTEFDRVVLEIVTEAGQWVPSGYIRARAGGPRWKVQAALGRLVDVEELERRGTTSATRYRVGRRAS